MRSMTGFGIGEASSGAIRVSLELRSVNHRYCDIRLRLAPEYADHAFFLEQIARKLLGRGRFDVNVHVHGDTNQTLELDIDRVRHLFCSLAALRDELAPGESISVAAILAAPGAFRSTETDRARELDSALEQALKNAIQDLDAMRKREGNELASVLRTYALRALSLVQSCRSRSLELPLVYRTKLQERLARLLSDASSQFDEPRLEQELALLAEKTDITEELTRLVSHLDHFVTYLDAAEPVGRRLDFLLQEIARESNTLSAKCQDSDLSLLVVELKVEAERMREQVQNVE